MALDMHFKQQFQDTAAKQLAGSQSRPLLLELIERGNKKGEAIFIDRVGTGEDGDISVYSDLNIGTDNWAEEGTLTNSRAKYEALVAQYDPDEAGVPPEPTGTPDTYENRKALLGTPHNEISRERTMLTPRNVRWGYQFKDHDQVFELLDPQSKTMRQGMRRMFRRMDALILHALFKATTIRQKYFESTPNAVNISAFNSGSQLFNSATGTGAPLKLSTLSQVVQIFEDNEADDEPIIGVISPTAKKSLIDAEGSKIHSSDFVDRNEYFMSGKLPEIYGVHLVSHAKCPANKCAFFTRSALFWNTFLDLYTKVGESPHEEFDTIAFMKMLADCQRIEDARVVQVTLTTG